MAGAVYYDGETARRRLVSLCFTATTLDLLDRDGQAASWPFDRIRQQDGPSGILRLALDNDSLARLEITDEADGEAIRARCPALDAGDGRERTGRIVAWSLAAAASLLVCALVIVPFVADRAVPLVPISLEKRLGTAIDNQIRFLLPGKICEAPAGRDALRKLSTRLLEAGPSLIPPEIAVLSSSIPNAVALPGGRIYLFEGLLKKATSADEVAGVLAHEIGHVAHRDGLRTTLQTGGTSFLLGLFFGDVTGGGTIIMVSRLALDSVHSREAESAADTFATTTMLALGRPPQALGELLKRIDPGGGAIPAFLLSHPATEDRLQALSRQAPSQLAEPLLTDEEWRSLKEICKAE